MQNFYTIEKVFNEHQSSYKRLQYLIKDIVKESDVNKLELNINMFEQFFNEINNDENFQIEKCDNFYLYTFFSYYVLGKKHKNYFFKLFYNYSILYFRKNYFGKSFSVILLYLKLENENIVFSLNECKEQFTQTIHNYNEEPFEIFENLSLNYFLVNENSKKIFIQFIYNQSGIFSLEQLKGLSYFFQKNSLEISQMVYENNEKYINSYYKTIFRLVLKCYLLIEQNYKDNISNQKLIFSYTTNIIYNNFLYFPKLKKDNLDNKNIFIGISSIISKISLILSKNNKIYDNNIRYCLDSLENSLLSLFNQDNNFLKHYSNNLGKIQNIFTILKDDEYSKKYSQKIIQLYKNYKFVFCELLLIQIGTFNSYLIKINTGHLEIDFHENIEKIKNIITLFNACVVNDKIDKENYNDILSFFIEKIEFLFKIIINKKKYLGEFIELSKDLLSDFINLNANKRDTIKDNFIFDNFLNLIKLILSNESIETLNNFLHTFDKIKHGEKRAHNYFYFLAYFLTSQKAFIKMKILLEEIIRFRNIKMYLIFYSKILYFLNTFKVLSLDINLDLFEIICSSFANSMSNSLFIEIENIVTEYIIPLFSKNIINSFNEDSLQYIDYLSNNNNENEEGINKLNDIMKKFQSISYFTEKFIGYYSEYSKTKNIHSEIYTFHLYLIINFFIKVEDISSDDILILVKNQNVLKAGLKEKLKLNFVHFILFRMIIYKKKFNYMKYANNNIITAYLKKIIDEEIEIIQEKNDIENKLNEVKDKCEFKFKTFLYKEIKKIQFDNFKIDDYSIFSKDNKTFYQNFKIKFIMDMNLIGENLKIALLINDFNYYDKNLKIINNYINILNEINLNCEFDREIEFLKIFKFTFSDTQEELNIDLNIICHLNNIDKENQRFFLLIEKIYIIKICSKFLIKYNKELSKTNLMTNYFKNIKTDIELKLSNKKNLNIYEAIIFSDLRYYEYMIYYKEKKFDLSNIISFIQKTKKLIGYIESLILKIINEKKINEGFSEIEKMKISLTLHFLIGNKIINNSLITLIGNFDYQIIIFDLFSIYKNLSLIYFQTLKEYGFCDMILLQIKKFDKFPILKYDTGFYIKCLEFLIKIFNKWERKFNYEIWYDVGNFSSLDDFQTFEKKVLIEYICNKYTNIKSKDNDDINNLIDKYEIYDDYVINKYLGLCENIIDKSSSQKVIYIYFKNKSKLDNTSFNDELKNLFKNFFPINDLSSYFITNFRNIQYKYIIKLIPYIFLNDFYNRILIPEPLEAFFDITQGMFKEFKFDWTEYKILKHLKKIIKQLIYFSSFLNDNEMTKNIIIFYVKYFHNFKSNILYSNNKISIEDIYKKNNIIITLRIKTRIFLFIKYKTKCAYNVIDYGIEDINSIFKKMKTELNSSRALKLKVNLMSKMNENLEIEFFNLENKLICNSKEIKNILYDIYSDNKNFRNYIKNLLNKNTLNFSVEEIIKELLEPIIKTKKKNIKKSKKKILKQEDKSSIKKEIIDQILTLKSNIFSQETLFFYIPSTELSKLPLENLPLLYNFSIIRTISLKYINELPLEINISKKNDIFYLLNPSKDLIKTQNTLTPLYEENQIKGIKGDEPKRELMSEILTNKKIFIYSGHGDGTKYVSLDFLYNNKINFLMFLFGCSSANVRMFLGNDTQPFGLPQICLFNKCPFFLGCLWNVSSHDIDYFTLNLFNLLFNKDKKVSLIQSIIEIKKEMNLRFCNSSAIVVYGNNDINLYISS